MKPGWLAALFVWSGLLCTAASADWLAGERWSDPGSTAGWTVYPDPGTTLSQDAGNLVWTFDPVVGMGYLVADSGSSGGALVGDIAAMRADYYSFDFYTDPGVAVNQLYVYLDSPSSVWYYALAPPAAGQWTHYELMLDTLPGHAIHQLGSETLDESLAHVLTVMLEVGTPGGGASGRLDNFGVERTPEPATVALFACGLGAALLRRARRKSAPRQPR